MSRELRLYLACTAVTLLGLVVGLVWARSGLAVNLLHLVLGSVFIGFTLGNACGQAFGVAAARREEE